MLRQMIILSAISFSFICADEESIPDWYLNPPKEDGRLFGVGEDNLRMKAIIMALNDLENNYQSIITAEKDSISEYSTDSIPEIPVIAIKSPITKSISTSSISGDLIEDLTNRRFHMTGVTEQIIENIGSNATVSTNELMISLVYSDSGNLGMTSRIEYYLNEQMGTDGKQEFSDLTEHFEAFYLQMDETKLIEELERYGFRFEYALDEEGNHYVLINVDK